jgi:hypothetical protein
MLAKRSAIMNNKKAKIFLCISLICFVLIAIVTIISIRLVYYIEEQSLANAPNRPEFGGIIFFIAIYIIMIPGLATMLSGIRSTYKILKYKLQGKVKICYLISASVAFLSLVSVGLCFIVSIIIDEINIPISIQRRLYNFIPTTAILFGTLWPSFIISFVLGSIPIKHKKGMKL